MNSKFSDNNFWKLSKPSGLIFKNGKEVSLKVANSAGMALFAIRLERGTPSLKAFKGRIESAKKLHV
jgi:hypothetical protein